MKTIMITGASSGIGAATARKFLAEGWGVGLIARRKDALEEVADGHKNALILAGDVTDPEATERSFVHFQGSFARFEYQVYFFLTNSVKITMRWPSTRPSICSGVSWTTEMLRTAVPRLVVNPAPLTVRSLINTTVSPFANGTPFASR